MTIANEQQKKCDDDLLHFGLDDFDVNGDAMDASPSLTIGASVSSSNSFSSFSSFFLPGASAARFEATLPLATRFSFPAETIRGSAGSFGCCCDDGSFFGG